MNPGADTAWKAIIWRQFGAALDMLGNAMRACPEQLWGDRSRRPEFWYVAFHTLFYLDLYLSDSVEGFAPPAPFSLVEMQEDDLPERSYTRDELQAYLAYCRRKCQATIEALTDETAQRRCRFAWGDVSFVELQLYNMRHVQEHAAQLSLFLGQNGVSVPDSVTTAMNRAD